MKRKILLVALIIVFVLSITLAACEKNYNATFETNGGSAVEPQSISSLSSAPATTREGYVFRGWYLTSDFSDAGISYPYTLTGDTTFYAKWEAVSAENHIVDFITNTEETVNSRKICSVVEAAPEVTREGYTLVGWYENPACTGNAVTFPFTPTGTTVLYAKWEKIPEQSFLVDFDTNGGTSVHAKICSTVDSEPATVREGYIFAGWYDNAECSGNPIAFPYKVTKETILYAKWTPVEAAEFTVSFDTHGGSTVSDVKCSVIEKQPETTRNGYVLLGWYDNAEYTGNPLTFPYKVTKDITLHAKWEAKVSDMYTVRFETGIGSAIAARQTKTISTAPVTTVAGNYRFDGWYDNAEFKGSPISFPYTVTADVTLYARWSETGFTLFFETFGGTSLASMSNQLKVTKLDLPNDPTKADKVFGGWYLDEDCTNAVSYPYTLTKATTFYAKWNDTSTVPPEPVIPITFTVHFHDAGNSLNISVDGEQVATTIDTTSTDNRRGEPFITVNDKAIISVPNLTREGAVFLGWTATVNGTQYLTFPVEVVGNMVLYAHWQLNVEPNETDSALLRTYVDKAANNVDTFGVGYGMLIQNTIGTVDQTWYRNDYRPGKIVSGVYSYSDTANNGDGGWVLDYLDFAFARSDNDNYWMTYTEDPGRGSYQYGGRWYSAEPISDIEQGFYMVYLNKLSTIDTSKFYKYDGKWYAVADYVDTVGHIILGNSSGDPVAYEITYTQFALSFDENGWITGIDAKGNILDSYSYGTGIATTLYYATHTIQFMTFDPEEISDISESQFLQDQVRPSGLYPELNPNDDNRNGAVSDGIAYTTAQLQTALSSLQNYVGYYTLAGNTYSGFTYSTSTITTHGNYGIVKYDDYAGFTWGESTSAAQAARAPWYFKYDEATNAFFLAIPGSSGYSVYCDQYSYKNTYSYNQYLLGVDGAISFNCKYPAVGLRLLDASDFTFNAAGGYFEFNGNEVELKAIGQTLFGDMDFTYPEQSETEEYVYLRLYMNDSKIVKAVAATRLVLSGGGTEFFIKEFVITSYTSDNVTLPGGIEAQCIAPGEADVNGSISGLQTAINTTKGKNHKYTDIFAFDDDDEIGGVGFDGHSESGDVYTYYNGITRLGENGMTLYFKNGVLYEVGANGSPLLVGMDNRYINNDIDKANSLILWPYSMAELLDACWFYQGKDGNYYGKQEYMDKLAWALGRYSGSEQYLEAYVGMTFGPAYNAFLKLEFVRVTVDSYGLETIYYSGSIHVDGMNGSHDKPFSAYATFTYSPSSITVNDTFDATRPAVYQYINTKYSFDVDYEGFLNLVEVPNASGYKAYVYNLTTDTLVAEFDVTNGFDLKSVEELNVTADVKYYRLAIQALGDGVTPINGVVYRDGAQSGLLAIELSTVPKQAKPVVTLNQQAATVTVSGNYQANDYYSYVIKTGNKQIANGNGNKRVSEALNLNDFSLVPYTTYTIEIFVMGESGTIRDSETVTLVYTPPRTNGVSYLSDLFNAINFENSFKASFSSSATPRSNILDGSWSADELFQQGSTWLNQHSVSTTSMLMYYDKNSNTGKLTFTLTTSSLGEGDKARPIDIKFLFSKQGDKLVGTFVKKVFGNVTVNETKSFNLFFGGIAELEDGFVEKSGAINAWSGLYYQYQGNLANADTQATIAGFSPLEELLGYEEIAYTGMQLTVGYQSSGALISECAASLVGEANGQTIIVKIVFSSFGQDLSTWSKD